MLRKMDFAIRDSGFESVGAVERKDVFAVACPVIIYSEKPSIDTAKYLGANDPAI